ncbi:MarR family transcriptional regulator [Streptomyces sp. NPDC048417]|uniref:MarR family winged helix-turn-helix transcriptional regulator n=1 Tax=Streptomyces sp. NPDC048417 TaxID=3155387 RepID=UPI003443F8AD
MVGTQTRPSLLYMVKQLELVVRSHLDELVRPAGITALQYTALTILERHDGLSAAQLARDSFVTAQSMADLVRSLESRALIRRERNPRNRRELLILLTDAGRELLAGVAGPVRELEERMVRELTGHQEEQFRQALGKAWHALS